MCLWKRTGKGLYQFLVYQQPQLNYSIHKIYLSITVYTYNSYVQYLLMSSIDISYFHCKLSPFVSTL